MTAPDLLVCPSCNRQKEEFWPDGFCGPDVCLNPDCNSQVAAPAAMTPEVAKLVEAAWQMLIEYDEANIEPEPRSMTSAAIRLRAALAALRAGGDG